MPDLRQVAPQPSARNYWTPHGTGTLWTRIRFPAPPLDFAGVFANAPRLPPDSKLAVRIPSTRKADVAAHHPSPGGPGR